MAALTLGLQNLRRQVDEAFPGRDKTSDGWIGDAAHRGRASGHNPDDTAGSRPSWDGDPDRKAEVRAWDMDADLDPGVSTQAVVDHIRRLPGLGTVLRYMIYNRRIYHVQNGFASAPYSGDDPRTNHVHYEGAWTQGADDNSPAERSQPDDDGRQRLRLRRALRRHGAVRAGPGRDPRA